MEHNNRVFRESSNNREDPADSFQALGWAYRRDYKQEQPVENNARKEFLKEAMKILFSSHLLGKT